ATHQANFNGIPATGKKIDVYEAGVFRLAHGKITEAWFMADEAGLLKKLGAKLPARQDGKLMAPPVTGEGDDPDAVVKRLEAGPLSTREDRNQVRGARFQSGAPPAAPHRPAFTNTP